MKQIPHFAAAFCAASLLLWATPLAEGALSPARNVSMMNPGEDSKEVSSAGNADLQALVEDILQLSGDKEQVEQLPALFQSSLEQRRQTLNPEVYAVLSQAFASSYQAEALYRTVVEHFQSHSDRRALETVREWLRTPQAQKMARLQVDAGTPEAQAELVKYVAGLEANPPSQERVGLIIELDEAVGVTEWTLTLTVSTTRSILDGIQLTLPAEKRMDEAQIEQGINALRAQLQAPLRNSALVGLLYTFRSVSDQELGEYVAFWQSELGQWFGETTKGAYLEALAAAAKETGRRIAESAPQYIPAGASK